MRIGIISTTKDLPWAATDEVWARFATVALNQGHKVHASVHHSLCSSERLEVLSEKGLAVSVRNPFRPTRLYLLKERYASEMKPLEDFEPDIVLFNGGSILDAFHQPNLNLFCHRFPGKIVFFCHGHSEDYWIPDRDKLTSFLSTKAGLVFVSEENLRTLETQLAVNFPSAKVIRNSPSMTLDAPMPTRAKGGGASLKMACVARVEAFWKGHDVLLRVLSSPEWMERSWSLDIHGRGGDEEHVRKLADHLGIRERVRLRGQTEDILGIWREADMLVLPTRAESLSLAVLEAMICGRLVVTTDVGDHRYFIQDGETGFLAEASTPYSFGNALERAWQSWERWEEIGIAAHRRAAEQIRSKPEQCLLEYLDNLVC